MSGFAIVKRNKLQNTVLKQISIWPYGHVMSHDKRKILYPHFHKVYKHQTWDSIDLGWGFHKHEVTLTI